MTLPGMLQCGLNIVFGSHVQASGVATSILGNGGIAATVSGQNTQTISVNAVLVHWLWVLLSEDVQFDN